MVKNEFPVVEVAGKRRILNVRPDPPDIRDRMYEPALIQLQAEIDHRKGCLILDQKDEGACTGFGLAAAINLLNRQKRNLAYAASPRMLYEMAKKHDEWPGEDYAGSSCRGAIRGWKNMGVCSAADWPYLPNQPGELTIARAKAARACVLGAYYRLRPELNDYHVALNEVGTIFVSADVHAGWFSPSPIKEKGLAVIKPTPVIEGGHAFALVGYNAQGFIVQNSWGKKWGSRGFALWMYEDWLDNINDGWVFRLALPTPNLFGLTSRSKTRGGVCGRPAPKRLEIAGHFVHFDNGAFKARGDYWSSAEDVQRTATQLRQSADQGKYDHLLLYAHGGLNTPEEAARRVAALKDGCLRNRIYPFHIMYDTGLAKEIGDAVIRAATAGPAAGFFGDLTDKLIEQSDHLLEDLVRKPVTPVWDEMKRDARLPFEVAAPGPESDGLLTIRTFAEALAGSQVQIHLAGHSTGAVLVGHLLRSLDELGHPDIISSCSLLAPACTLDFYREHYQPRLLPAVGAGVRLPCLDIYNLNEQLELDDNVAYVYRKSLLYLVSRALERESDKPLLGMQLYAKQLAATSQLNIRYSDGQEGATSSTSHGGFDNDANTMNTILRRVLGAEAALPYLPPEMEGY
ncbi:MAG: C1 family peptidase [Desulfobulbaceae bacterium]|nr:C1 family peptidase [Desulfobulbaceae bacterium]